MAQIVEVVGVGEVEFPDSMSKEQITVALQKLPKPKFEPTSENRGNVINTDVPTVVGSQPNAVNPQPVQKPVTMMDRVKTLYEVPTAVVAPLLTEPASMLYGLGRSAVEGAIQGKMPTGEARDEYYRQAKRNIEYVPSSPESQAIMGTIGEGLTAAKIPPYIPTIGKIPSAIQNAPPVRPAINNMAQALRNEGQMVQEAVTPTIQRGIEAAKPVVAKVAETVEPVTTRMAQVLRSEPKIDIAGIAKTAPEVEDLAIKSSALFKQAKESGVELNPQYFSHMMKSVGKDLRSEGYDARWRIEHAQIVSGKDQKLFSKRSIIPSVQPTHATSDAAWADSRLCNTINKGGYAYQNLLRQSKIIALGTDFPVEGISPIHTFYSATQRMDAGGKLEKPFIGEQALSRKQALWGMTLWAAYANFDETRTGSLETGKLADFVVLNTDIMTAEPSKIVKAKVKATYLGGTNVYTR